uniref:diguanylate cyclase domain-containing protein n=1 Tax=Escherichia coli TaxID=562 RepID=UPI00201B8B73
RVWRRLLENSLSAKVSCWLIRLLILGSGYNTMISHLGLIRTFPNDEEACRAGVRICQLVDNHAITHSEGHINITVTAGVSRAFPEEPLDVVIGRADRAMYEGKQTGRNRCMFIDEQNVINRV